MKRRDFIVLAGAAAAFPRVALAQQAAKVPRIAFLHLVTAPEFVQAVLDGLADFGYVEGKNIVVETFVPPTATDAPSLAAKAVASKPDLIVVTSDSFVSAAQAATTTIPIVFGATNDPVTSGFVSNLAHPGGNLTGATSFAAATTAQQFGIFREIIPTLTRVAFFEDVDSPIPTAAILPVARSASASLGIELIVIRVKEGEDFAHYLAQATANAVQGIYLPNYSYFTAQNDGKALRALQIKNKLPTTEGPASFGANSNGVLLNYLALLNKLPTMSVRAADDGGLASYGVTAVVTYRRLGYYVDAILKGAKPGDLPVELGNTFDLVINLKTAKALGITIPPSVDARATRIIE